MIQNCYHKLYWTLFVLVLLLSAQGSGFAQVDPVRVVCPDSVGQGEPFFCTITLAPPVKGCEAVWNGRTIQPVLSRNGKVLTGKVLLSAGLTWKEGPKPLVFNVYRKGETAEKIKTNIQIEAREFPVQKLTLPPNMVTPPQETLTRIRSERKTVLRVLGTVTPAQFWTSPFQRPVSGKLLSPFGVKRVLNGKPRSRHKGIDLRGNQGTEVMAVNAGIVALVQEHYFAGKSVYIDHGHGVVSMYFHLSDYQVEKDQVVSKGQPVGLIGSTGRVTGPHLHFGMSILGEAVDPLSLFSSQP